MKINNKPVDILAIQYNPHLADECTVIFKYTKWSQDKHSYPIDIQEQNGDVYWEALKSVQANCPEISGHISFKEIRSLIQNDHISYHFVPKKFIIFQGVKWEGISHFIPVIEVYLSSDINNNNNNNKPQIEEFKNSLINYFYGDKNEIDLPVETSLAKSIKYTTGKELVIRFSTHPEDKYSFSPVPIEEIVNALKGSFGRYFKQYIENKYTVYKNNILLTRRN